jgi:hypothetical protein
VSPATRQPVRQPDAVQLPCGNVLNDVKRKAAFDMNCPENAVEVSRLSENEYGARGCGQKESCNDIPFVGLDCKKENLPPQTESSPAASTAPPGH